MSLDTKYRPLTYGEVIGQEATKTILKRFVSTGKGFQQSYLFAGGYGTGKTTLGRILARGLLCDSPIEGEPCNKCPSCLSILNNGSSDSFTEVDAATNSGKSEIKKLTEEINYDTFSGKQRIYLFDEAHQLSDGALDALLKPLEENIPGSPNKRLVCIFCTTEPEKMRATVLSRCAPAFVIDPLPPEKIADRLKHVCQEEGLVAEEEALLTIATVTECHIRDALKAIEGVSMLGSIDEANVHQYLQLDQVGLYLSILKNLGVSEDAEGKQDPLWGLRESFASVDALLQKISPATIYRKLAEASLEAYQAYLGVTKQNTYWHPQELKALGDAKGDVLLSYATRLAAKPGRPTGSMLKCDLASLHHGVTGEGAATVVIQQVQSAAATPQALTSAPTKSTAPASQTLAKPVQKTESKASALTGNGIWVDPRAVSKKGKPSAAYAGTSSSKVRGLSSEEFARLLVVRLAELEGAFAGGRKR